MTTLHRIRPAAPRARFDDGRNPELLADLLGDSSAMRKIVVLQLGSAVQFRWDAAEPDAIEVGMPAETITMPRSVARDLPPGWVVTAIDHEVDGNAQRTIIQLGRPRPAAVFALAA